MDRHKFRPPRRFAQVAPFAPFAVKGFDLARKPRPEDLNRKGRKDAPQRTAAKQ